MTFDGLQATLVTYVNSTTITAVTPAHAVGPVNVVITDGANNSYTLSNGYTYQDGGTITTTPITNANISSMICSPSTTNTNTTVNCAITTALDINTLSGSVNVRVGTAGTLVNCPITGSGTTLNCNNIPVGGVVGTFRSQFNASASGLLYIDGNNITVSTNVSNGGGTCTPGGSSLSTPGQTTVDLCVDGGTLVLYAGDSNKDNDICTTADIIAGNVVDTTTSGQLISSVTCNTSQNSIALTGVSTASKRQFATATINDIIFEDLRGLNSANYTVTATVSNFVDPNDVNKNITLGSNPDSDSNEIDQDRPTLTEDGNKIYAVIDPSGGTVSALRSAATIAEGTTNYIKGSRVTLIDNVTQVTLLSTSAPVKPGRIALDGVLFKLRIPSLISAGNFQGTIVETVI